MLNIKQQRFCELYVQYGEQQRAYMEAYGCKNKEASQASASRLMQNPEAIEYIDVLSSKIQNDNIATATEIQEFFTKIMRGEIQMDGIPPICRERLKGAELLAKCKGMMRDRIDTDSHITITMDNDWEQYAD